MPKQLLKIVFYNSGNVFVEPWNFIISFTKSEETNMYGLLIYPYTRF